MNEIANKYTKEEIDNAFYQVMWHQYKKDCPKAHEIIKDLGYKTQKFNGRFIIINEKTGKSISIVSIYRKPYVAYDTGKCRSYFEWDEKPIFDYINYLEVKRVNNFKTNENKAKQQYWNIYHCKHMIKSYEEDIQYEENAIKKLIRKIKYNTQCKYDYELQLKNYRKSYGLKERS